MSIVYVDFKLDLPEKVGGHTMCDMFPYFRGVPHLHIHPLTISFYVTRLHGISWTRNTLLLMSDKSEDEKEVKFRYDYERYYD